MVRQQGRAVYTGRDGRLLRDPNVPNLVPRALSVSIFKLTRSAYVPDMPAGIGNPT